MNPEQLSGDNVTPIREAYKYRQRRIREELKRLEEETSLPDVQAALSIAWDILEDDSDIDDLVVEEVLDELKTVIKFQPEHHNQAQSAYDILAELYSKYKAGRST